MANPTFDLSSVTLSPGLYSIRVKAKAKANKYRDSEFSVPIPYQVGYAVNASYSKGTLTYDRYISSAGGRIDITPNQGEILPEASGISIDGATCEYHPDTATNTAYLIINNPTRDVTVSFVSAETHPVATSDDKMIVTQDEKQLLFWPEGE